VGNTVASSARGFGKKPNPKQGTIGPEMHALALSQLRKVSTKSIHVLLIFSFSLALFSADSSGGPPRPRAGIVTCRAQVSASEQPAQAETKSGTSALPQLVQTIPLPHVKGGFDLMAVDLTGRRLFVNAEDNNTTEVIDLAVGRLARTIPGMHEPK